MSSDQGDHMPTFSSGFDFDSEVGATEFRRLLLGETNQDSNPSGGYQDGGSGWEGGSDTIFTDFLQDDVLGTNDRAENNPQVVSGSEQISQLGHQGDAAKSSSSTQFAGQSSTELVGQPSPQLVDSSSTQLSGELSAGLDNQSSTQSFDFSSLPFGDLPPLELDNLPPLQFDGQTFDPLFDEPLNQIDGQAWDPLFDEPPNQLFDEPPTKLTDLSPTQPSDQPSSQSSGKPSTELVGQSSTQSDSQSTTKRVGQPSVQLAVQPTTRLTGSPPTQPAGQLPTGFVGQSSTQLASQPITGLAGQSSTQPTGQMPTGLISQLYDQLVSLSSKQLVDIRSSKEPTNTKRVVYSDAVAGSNKVLYAGAKTERERIDRFCVATGRTVQLSDGTSAFARGHRPPAKRASYKFAPASNPDYDLDITTVSMSKHVLLENGTGTLPFSLAWIDDIRSPVPYPEHLTPRMLYKGNGQPELGINGEALRELDSLPRYISSAVEGWRLYFWFTIDSRITFPDIIARMHFKCREDGGEGPLSAGLKSVTKMLESRIDAFRRETGILAPLTTPFNHETYEVTLRDAQMIKRLSRIQLEYGTWWTIDEDLGIMVQPAPKDPNTPFDTHQYLLPAKIGMSPRVRKIYNECELEKQQLQVEIERSQLAALVEAKRSQVASPPAASNAVSPLAQASPMRTLSTASTANALMTPMSTPSPVASNMVNTSPAPQGRAPQGNKRAAPAASSAPKPKRKRSTAAATPAAPAPAAPAPATPAPAAPAPFASNVNNSVQSGGSNTSVPALMKDFDSQMNAMLGNYGAQRQEAALRKFMNSRNNGKK